MSARWPLVGRQDEMDRIAAAMGRHEVAGLVVTGPAGVGKTRLANEALEQASQALFAVYRVIGTRAAATVPLAALSHLLPEGDQREPAQADLLRRTARGIVARARPRRVVVGVDDAHLLDEASAALVHHLATVSEAFVLATLRDGERAADAVHALSKNDSVTRLTLSPLATADLDTALRHVLGGQVSGSLVHRLAMLSEGNPMLARELVDSALGEGRLVQHAGLWRLAGTWMSAKTLPELVRDRLERLDPEVYAAAQLLALGEPLGAAELEELLSPRVIAAAEREGLFAAVRSGRRQRVRLVHPLYGEALRAAIAPLQARAAHRSLADALAATGARRRGDVLRLAVSRLEAGQHSDPELLLRAAGEEGALFDRDMAERLAHAAEDAGGGLPARIARVDALRWLGRAGEADALLADAATGCRDLRQRCQVGVARAENLFYGLNRPDEADRVLAETRAQVGSVARWQDQSWKAALRYELDALQAGFWFNRGRPRDALRLATGVVDCPDPEAETLVAAASVASISHIWCGQPEQAAVTAEHALRRLPEQDKASAFTATELLLLCRAQAELYGGRFDSARQLATSRYQHALRHNADALQGQWALVIGQLELLSGRVATAARWLRESAELIQQHAPRMGRYGTATALAFLAEATALTGAHADADTAMAHAHAVIPPEALLYNQAGQAWTLAARGEISTACRTALHAAERLAAAGAHLHEATACHHVARLGEPGSVEGRMAELAGMLEGRLLPIYARHTHALSTRDAAALEAVSAEFADIGANLLAAEAAATAGGIHRDAGHRQAAIAAAGHARALASSCEGARTPALVRAAQPLSLTPRELEIATLAASGLADRDIACKLVLSERTVHNHLHHAYTKLGLTGRAQLRSILR